MEPEEPLFGAPERGPEREDIERVVDNIRAQDGAWTAAEPASYGSLRWRPDLARNDILAVLHVHLADRLRPYMLERLTAAFVAGREVHIALPLSDLYDEELLCAVHELDPQIHVIRSETLECAPSAALLTVLCDRRVQVTPKARTLLSAKAVEQSQGDASAQLRGRRYEAAIAFLLSQVDDFDVVERNLRTDTEELDAVVQQRTTQGRVVWARRAPHPRRGEELEGARDAEGGVSLSCQARRSTGRCTPRADVRRKRLYERCTRPGAALRF